MLAYAALRRVRVLTVEAFNAETIAFDGSVCLTLAAVGAIGGALDFCARKVKPTVTELAPLSSSRSIPVAWSSIE